MPYANTPEYRDCLSNLLKQEQPDLVRFQNDLEIWHASLLRDDILATAPSCSCRNMR
jgi:carbamoyl-phosphate synthase large subunit